jgi:dTDP-4-amino-4,6-dideoxygalactose transaminase
MIEYENLQKLNSNFFKIFNEKLKKFEKTGWYVLGNEVIEFEDKFAKYCNTNFFCGVASGLDAIQLSLRCINKKGGEVIVPSNTYIASILAVINEGYIPILVEPNINTYNLDPCLIEENITSNTVAILPVHLYGKLCEMDKICSLASKYQLKVIEDCAQAHGARYYEKFAGTFGDFGAFSFYPTKNLGAIGDAGGIICRDKVLHKKLKSLRNYGSNKKYHNDFVGLNSRLDEIQALFLNIKIEYLNEINSHKRKIANIYFDNLSNEIIKPEKEKHGYFDVHHIFPIRTHKRKSLKEYLLKHNIKTEIHYPIPPHKQKGYSTILSKKNYKISEEIHNTVLSLPISYITTKDDALKVCDRINKYFK